MEYKSLVLTLKEDGQPGAFLARIATLNEIDKDGDVTLAGAFPPAKEVLVSSYMHKSWDGALPVGKAVIREIGNEVLAEGQFNMDSETGQEHYAAVKFSGNLQEWSYGFRVNQAEPGTFQGQNVRFLRSVDPFEISPVLVGAGNSTATLVIKEAKAAIAVHHTATDSGDTQPWDGPANEARVRSGEDASYYSKVYAWKDPEGDPSVKSTYRFIHHEVSSNGNPGVADMKGCSSAIGILNGGRGVDVSAQPWSKDREGIYRHLAAHMSDGDMEPTPLKSQSSYADQGDRLLADLVDFAERTKELAALRAKDGRMISAANMERLRAMMERMQSVMSELSSLLEDATPPAKEKSTWAEYLRLKALIRSL